MTRVLYRWIDAWDGPGTVPGWCVCEMIEEPGGLVRMERCEPRYLHEHPEGAALVDIYLRASRALGVES